MGAVAKLLAICIAAGMELLERLDASRAAALRARLAADPVGVLVEQFGGRTDAVAARTDKSGPV